MLPRADTAPRPLWRRLVTPGLPAIVFCVLGLAIQSEAANLLVTFNGDTTDIGSTDTLSFSTDPAGSSRVKAIECPVQSHAFESCALSISRPSPTATISSADFPFQTLDTVKTVVIGEPGGSTVSDTLGYLPCSADPCPSNPPPGPDVGYVLAFNSDPSFESPSGIFGAPCSPAAVACPVIETGDVQVAGTVTWSDRTVDTINFQSDAADVPEPSSILLFLPGFAGVFAARRLAVGSIPTSPKKVRPR